MLGGALTVLLGVRERAGHTPMLHQCCTIICVANLMQPLYSLLCTSSTGSRGVALLCMCCPSAQRTWLVDDVMEPDGPVDSCRLLQLVACLARLADELKHAKQVLHVVVRSPRVVLHDLLPYVGLVLLW